jgi:hypothetical protein
MFITEHRLRNTDAPECASIAKREFRK